MRKIYIETLGCSKNWVESEKILGGFHPFSLTKNPSEAELIIINTCGFIEASRIESIETILDLAQYKLIGKCKNLVVSGCLVESHKKDLEKELPEVDYFSTPSEITALTQKLTTSYTFKEGITQGQRQGEFRNNPRYFLQNQGSNYLKVSEGCNHKCSFCTIPQFKGRLKSRLKEDIINEARFMVANGIHEINLVGQDLTAYGTDLAGENLESLLMALVKVKGIKWIRLLYLYPTLITKELIKIVKNEEKIARYFDVPFQYLDNEILRAMNRSGTVESYFDLVQTIRQEIEEVAIRTTIIVGYPGETEDHFNRLLSNIHHFNFNHLGVFEYSLEESTQSYSLGGHISDELKRKRKNIVMEAQSKLSSKHLLNRVGKEYEVLAEEVIDGDDENPIYCISRSEFEAPEVDGNVVVSIFEPPIKEGSWLKVSIKKSSEYDLYAVPVKNKEKNKDKDKEKNKATLSQSL